MEDDRERIEQIVGKYHGHEHEPCHVCKLIALDILKLRLHRIDLEKLKVPSPEEIIQKLVDKGWDYNSVVNHSTDYDLDVGEATLSSVKEQIKEMENEK